MPRPQAPHGPLRSYGRIQARAVKPRQAALFETLLPKIAFKDLEGRDGAVLEIGFGGGEHLAAQAARSPDILFVGAEPFVNGVASALRHVDEQNLANVRIHHGDAREVIQGLPDQSLSRVYIMFPDPWPKARHHKRRLIQAVMIEELARVLKPGGVVRFATDWADYADWTLERFARSDAFRWTAERADDWRLAPADHVKTRYEAKRLGDCDPAYLEFERV
jgi:tRNA (guanine-N7-)-methyltransferase